MDADRKARLGNRWSCSECGMAFYDLGKPEAVCPGCSTQQVAQLPAKKKRATKKAAGNYRRPLRQRTEPEEEEVSPEDVDEDDGSVGVDLDS